jgi:hypothetical protein
MQATTNRALMERNVRKLMSSSFSAILSFFGSTRLRHYFTSDLDSHLYLCPPASYG